MRRPCRAILGFAVLLTVSCGRPDPVPTTRPYAAQVVPPSPTVGQPAARTASARPSATFAISPTPSPIRTAVPFGPTVTRPASTPAFAASPTPRATASADPAGPGDLAPTLALFEAAAVRGDWRALYDLMNSDVTSANTPDQFVALMAQADLTLGPIIAMRRLTIGSLQTDAVGVNYVVVGYEIERRAPDGPKATRSDAFFLLEGMRWKLWYTEER